MKLDTVVISLILEERNLLCANLMLWDLEQFYPCIAVPEQKIPLTINLLASAPRSGFENKVRSIYNSTEKVKYCFSDLQFIYSDYQAESKFVNTMPAKSFINTLESLGKKRFLLMDVAAIAIKPNWLVLVEKEAALDRFWVKGAKYEGISELESYSKDAFHASGIYAIDEEFQAFISSIWNPQVEKHAIIAPELSAHEILYKAIQGNSNEFDSSFLAQFVSSSIIANHEGSYERKHSEGVALRKLMRDPGIAIGIGKHLFRELETIDLSYKEYRKIVRQYFKTNKI